MVEVVEVEVVVGVVGVVVVVVVDVVVVVVVVGFVVVLVVVVATVTVAAVVAVVAGVVVVIIGAAVVVVPPLAAAHLSFTQLPLTQSRLSRQLWALRHGEQIGPPQSISVLPRPLLVPSEQVGGTVVVLVVVVVVVVVVPAWQKPFRQPSLTQSRLSTQVSPVRHGVQQEPPQSMSVSSPSRLPSLHIAIVALLQVVIVRKSCLSDPEAAMSPSLFFS